METVFKYNDTIINFKTFTPNDLISISHKKLTHFMKRDY